jgi:hypothetical protein
VLVLGEDANTLDILVLYDGLPNGAPTKYRVRCIEFRRSVPRQGYCAPALARRPLPAATLATAKDGQLSRLFLTAAQP